MATESDRPEVYMEGAFEMMSWGIEGGLEIYSLDAQPKDVPSEFWGYFGIYPRPFGLKPLFLAFTSEPNKDLTQIRRDILAVQLPERIKALNINPDDAARKDFEALCMRVHAPSMLIAVGEISKTQENLLFLITVMGIAPEEALRTIQNGIRESIARKN